MKCLDPSSHPHFEYAPGTFETRCECPDHPGRELRRLNGLGRCWECLATVDLCIATFGRKECVREKGHVDGHVSPSGSAWSVVGSPPSPHLGPGRQYQYALVIVDGADRVIRSTLDPAVLSTRRVLIRFDNDTDVVSAFLAGSKSSDVAPAPFDRHLLLDRDEGGCIVGIEVHGARALVPAAWRTHPDRVVVPPDILEQVDSWFAQFWIAQESPGGAMNKTIVDAAARAAHEANRAWCLAHGDTSQIAWEGAPEWQRVSCIHGVEGVMDGNGPRESHERWLAEKAATGWKYGPVKNPEAKEHPWFVAYDRLPSEQKAKDAIFVAVVQAILGAAAVLP